MANKIQNPKSKILKNTRLKGFTLLEVTIASALFSAVIVTAMASFMASVRVSQAIEDTTKVVQTSRFAMEGILRDLRLGHGFTIADNGSALTVELDRQGRQVKYELKDEKLLRDGQAVVSGEVAVSALEFSGPDQASVKGMIRQPYVQVRLSVNDFELVSGATLRNYSK